MNKILTSSILLLAATACVPGVYHVAPRSGEPSAKITIAFNRTVPYRGIPTNSARIDGLILTGVYNGNKVSSDTAVRPGRHSISLNTHEAIPYTAYVTENYYEYRNVMESYSESYACGTTTSGYGSYRSTSTRYCRRQAYRYVSKAFPKTRTVLKTFYHRINYCNTTTTNLFRNGTEYYLTLVYQGSGNCSVTCHTVSRNEEETIYTPCPLN